MNIKLAVVVSDIHCGSEVGLAHPRVRMECGNIIGFGKNEYQRWLWNCWRDGWKQALKIAGSDKFALLVNGDATEGVHHGAKDVLTNKIEEHIAMAHECLRPYAEKASAVFLSKGTECHTLNMENLLAERLNAETGKAKNKWLIDFNGCLVDMAHHMPTSGRRYLEAGALSITMGNARQNYLDAGHRAPKVFLRGHRHCGGWYNSGHAAIGVTGGFQALTRHGHKVVTDSLPSPSIIVLDWRGLPTGALPSARLIKFDPPAHEVAHV
jgi:hypothetical protein